MRAFVEIAGSCNLACSFCPSSGGLAKNHMSLGFFSALLPDIEKNYQELSLHVLGEPLLHPDFSAMLGLIDTTSLKLVLSTNGLLLSRHKTHLFASRALHQINISIHSLAELHSARQRQDILDQIGSFCREAMVQRPGLYINLRLWNMRNDKLPAEPDPFSRELDAWAMTQFGVGLPSPQEHRVRRGIRLVGKLYVQYDTIFDWPGDESLASQVAARHQGRCHGLLKQVAILSDGRVVPCCLDHGGAISLGTLNPLDPAAPNLGQILDSPRARAIAQGFQNGVLVEEFCQHCTFCRRFS